MKVTFSHEIKWYERLWWRVQRFFTDLKYLPKEVKYFWQRGRRGWSDRDSWNFDTYLARIISEALKWNASHRNSCPNEFFKCPAPYNEVKDSRDCDACKKEYDGECIACTEWENFLLYLSEEFRLYNDGDNPVETEIYKDREMKFVPCEDKSGCSQMVVVPEITEEERERLHASWKAKDDRFKKALQDFIKYFGSYWD